MWILIDVGIFFLGAFIGVALACVVIAARND